MIGHAFLRNNFHNKWVFSNFEFSTFTVVDNRILALPFIFHNYGNSEIHRLFLA